MAATCPSFIAYLSAELIPAVLDHANYGDLLQASEKAGELALVYATSRNGCIYDDTQIISETLSLKHLNFLYCLPPSPQREKGYSVFLLQGQALNNVVDDISVIIKMATEKTEELAIGIQRSKSLILESLEAAEPSPDPTIDDGICLTSTFSFLLTVSQYAKYAAINKGALLYVLHFDC